MADEPMMLPESQKPTKVRHAEDEVTKDPTSHRFWRVRNILALILMGVVPVAGKEIWGSISEFQERQKALEARLIEIERDRSANDVIRGDLADLKDRMTEHEINYRVAIELQKRMTEILWTKAVDQAKSRPPEENPVIPNPPKPEPPPDIFKVPRTNPSQYKLPNEPAPVQKK